MNGGSATGKDRGQPAQAVSDAEMAARAAGLRYVNDDDPGITRRRYGRGFAYRHPDGRPVRERDVLARIRSLVVPPAWTDVWICPSANGHIQATGRDGRGRKQYRYHAQWTALRDETKYERTIAFAEALPTLRAQVERDLGRSGLPREKVVAAVVRLLETTMLRVGNEEYARQNRSFGLTTLRDRHADINGTQVRFSFRGKAGKMHNVGLRDRRLARIVRQCQDLPGQRLFQYYDEAGDRQSVTSEDVNEYIRQATGGDFTAKDFRTWAGTFLAAQALREVAEAEGGTVQRRLARAVEAVAQSLGNTPAVCRRCYIHPAVVDAYLEGSLAEALRQRTEEKLTTEAGSLSDEERLVLTLLGRRLAERAREVESAA
ncbi:MAG TPA: DNA topoisomerase IB [Candidatus Caenarcaniphilales bacterium]|nr:DNA topoisomerase IB [Candidatus Caenarcaniphilales bacterium]